MENVSSAYWLDVIAKIECGNTSCADGILADSAKKGNQLVTFIVYDLPNRDCHAKASNGEICCTTNPDGTCNYDAGGDCSAAIARYKSSYIDALVRVFSKYPSVPIVAIVEPDSLPNLATNQGDPHCGNSATTAAYTIGIPYAVSSLTKLSHVSVRNNSKFVFFPLFIDLHLAIKFSRRQLRGRSTWTLHTEGGWAGRTTSPPSLPCCARLAYHPWASAGFPPMWLTTSPWVWPARSRTGVFPTVATRAMSAATVRACLGQYYFVVANLVMHRTHAQTHVALKASTTRAITSTTTWRRSAYGYLCLTSL